MQLLLLRLLLQLLLVPPSVCLPEWNVGGGVCVLMLLMPVLARLFGGVSFCGLRARSDVRVAGVHG